VVRSWGVDMETYPRAGRACSHVGARASALRRMQRTEPGAQPSMVCFPLRHKHPTACWRSPPPPRCCAAPAGPLPSTAARRPQLQRVEHRACVCPNAMACPPPPPPDSLGSTSQSCSATAGHPPLSLHWPATSRSCTATRVTPFENSTTRSSVWPGRSPPGPNREVTRVPLPSLYSRMLTPRAPV
jgi:hypothetical protein